MHKWEEAYKEGVQTKIGTGYIYEHALKLCMYPYCNGCVFIMDFNQTYSFRACWLNPHHFKLVGLGLNYSKNFLINFLFSSYIFESTIIHKIIIKLWSMRDLSMQLK